MRYVVSYDIGDDRIRLKVAQVLQAHGERVQESVFECVLAPDELDELSRRLAGLLEGCEDGEIRVYRLCESCLQHSFGIGRNVAAPAARRFIIV